jgi:hypothetical protein
MTSFWGNLCAGTERLVVAARGLQVEGRGLIRTCGPPRVNRERRSKAARVAMTNEDQYAPGGVEMVQAAH